MNNSYYSKDKNNIYFSGRMINNSDPKSFKIIDYNNASDKNNTYQIDNHGVLKINKIGYGIVGEIDYFEFYK